MTRIPLGLPASVPDEKDLRALAEQVGTARIVALGEGTHLASEPLEFRNRFFRYLVQHEGFTAIAIESGLVESQRVAAYIDGRAGDLGEALGGIGWTFDRLPQNRKLIVWMRQYNEEPTHPKRIHFYGFDISGSPGNVNAHEEPRVAIEGALAYLQRADLFAAQAFRARLSPWLPYLTHDFVCPAKSMDYAALSSDQRDRLSHAVSEMVDWVGRHKSAYTARTSSHDYVWGYRAAVAARQLDRWFRSLPLPGEPCHNPFAVLARTDQVRDRIQADNLKWIEEIERPPGKILVFAHTLHLARTSIERCWGAGKPKPRADGNCATWSDAGTYLDRWYGSGLVVLGGFIGAGSVGCSANDETVEPPAPESIAGILNQVAPQTSAAFALNLRSARNDAGDALTALRPVGTLSHWGDAWQDYKLAARSAFDVVIYFRTVTPACAP